jgi:hypothetical protein
MKRNPFAPQWLAWILFFVCLFTCSSAWASPHMAARRTARWYTWHDRYYHSQFQAPVALVVPPTASLETSWGWGVSNTRISRINHQFTRPYPGFFTPGAAFRPTPVWPSDTRHIGVYYVRGPW